MFKKFKSFVPYALYLFPMMALAQNQSVDSLQTGAEKFLDIINAYVIPIIFAFAFVMFIWGVFKYVKSAGDEGARKEGHNLMIYGIIGLFVMSAVWGLVRVVGKTVDLSGTTTPIPLPDISTQN